MTAATLMPAPLLPWECTAREDTLFRRLLRAALGLCLLLAIALTLLPVRETSFTLDEASTPLTRVVLEKVLEQAPEQVPKQVPEEKTAPLPPPPEAATVKPEPEPALEPEPEPEPVPQPAPRDRLAEARNAAAAAGVLSFRDDLQSLRDAVDVEALNRTRTSRGAADAAEVQRRIVADTAPARSGGIHTASLSTDTGGPALAGRETTSVRNAIAGAAGTGMDTRLDTGMDASTTTTGGRSDEVIRRVMDRNKAATFALYNRALRVDPLLEGKLVFEMVIQPDGSISELNLLSSELADEQLTRSILARIRMISFGAEDVLTTRVNYAFDFLPYI